MKNIINTKLMLLVLLLFAGPYLHGQSYKGLRIGEEFPEVTAKVLYGGQPKLSTAQFNNRLLIIDFWATSCSGCVAAMPHMQRLQQQFGERLKILPVTFEQRETVDAFWKRNEHTRDLDLATVVEDSLIKAYFPHVAIPHEVWIYKGKVIGITDPEYVDSTNINLVLAGKIPTWPFKNDFYTFDGKKERLFKTDDRQIDLARTWLTYSSAGSYRQKDGASAAGVFGSEGSLRDTATKTIRTWFVNQPILVAYLSNWMKVVPLQQLNKPSFATDPNQILWEVKDPLRYMHRSPVTPELNSGYNGDWMRKNAICFESVRADTGQQAADIAKEVIADLNRLFNLNVRWEKRKEKVLVLAARPAHVVNEVQRPQAVGSYTVTSVADLVYHFNQQPLNPYLFLAKGLDGQKKLNVSIRSWTDIEALRLTLKQCGLDLQEQERQVDKLVFTEINKEN